MTYEIGAKVLGNWQIIKEIGHGAFGHVYEIQKTEFGITVRSALKVIQIPTSEREVEEVLSDGMDEHSVTPYFHGIVEDFVREIAVMTDLSGNTNIIGYQDHKVIEHTDRIGWDILIRMELLESLVSYQLREGTFSEEQIISLGIDIARALSICHKKGIVHRDIKPGNIFVNTAGDFKLGDFGVARALEKTTGGLSKKGTESYMAPEIYRGKAYGKTVDIYSLGIVLYKCANRNRLPFYPTDKVMVSYEQREEAIIRRMGGEPLPAPCGVSPELGMIILKCCQYDAQKRWQEVNELRAALDKVKYQRNVRREYDESEITYEGVSLSAANVKRIETSIEKQEASETPESKDNGISEETIGVYANLREETIGINESSSKETLDVNDYSYREDRAMFGNPTDRRAAQVQNDYRDIWEYLDELYKEGEIITKDMKENTSREKHLSYYFTPDQNHNKKAIRKTIIPSVTDILDYFENH